MLSGKYQGATGKAGTGRLASGGSLTDRFRAPANVALVDPLSALAQDYGHTLLDLAFAWLLAFPAVSSVIAGATTPEQVRANVATAGWELGEVELRALAAVLEVAR